MAASRRERGRMHYIGEQNKRVCKQALIKKCNGAMQIGCGRGDSPKKVGEQEKKKDRTAMGQGEKHERNDGSLQTAGQAIYLCCEEQRGGAQGRNEVIEREKTKRLGDNQGRSQSAGSSTTARNLIRTEKEGGRGVYGQRP